MVCAPALRGQHSVLLDTTISGAHGRCAEHLLTQHNGTLWVHAGVIDLHLFDFDVVQFCYFPLDFFNDVRCLVVELRVLVLGVEERDLEAEIHQAFAHCVFDPFNVNSTSDVVPRWQPLQPIFVI